MIRTSRRWLFHSLLIFIILFISAVIYGIFLYMDLNEERTEDHDKTRRELLQQTALMKIDKIENFFGEEAYHVVYGKNDKDVAKIIFYPLEGNEKRLTTVNADEVLPKSAMIDQWQSECSSCNLVKVTPALLDNKILWELVYYDEEDRYVFDYRSIYDGSHYEDIRYRRQFN